MVQERDRHLLSEVGVMRDHRPRDDEGGGRLRLHRAASTSRLLALTRAGLLRRFFVGSVASRPQGDLHAVCPKAPNS